MGLKAGHQIEIICFEFNNWSKTNNDRLIQALVNVKIIKIDAGRSDFFSWGWSLFSEKICRIICKLFISNLDILSQGVSRRSVLLGRALNKVNKPDIVIGHTPGALWPTMKAAKKFNCRAGFDVEDYHPGEGNDKKLQALTKQLMIKLIPKFNYVSFASPLILKQVQQDTGKQHSSWYTILNYFPKAEFQEPVKLNEGPIKMVWFSQNINAGRGLELILPFIKNNIGKVELHLFGHLNQIFYEKNLYNIANIIIHLPMLQTDLHKTLHNFDLGLALDVPVDINRDMVITNKFLAYLQAGLFVIATNTNAQKALLKSIPQHGLCFDHMHNDFEIIMKDFANKIAEIRKQKLMRFNNFKNTNWENASINLLNHWNK